VNKVRFVNLHHLHHTTYSFGDGYGTPEQHIDRAVSLRYSAIAFTEHGNVSSHFRAEKHAIKAGIKPIFGLEAYCGPTDLERRGQYKYHLTILAATTEGYRNLNRIVTQSYRDYYYHPTVSGASLSAHKDGLVVLSGCSGSLLACTLLGGKGTPEHLNEPDVPAAREVIERFQACFADNYFLEVQNFPKLEKICAMNVVYEKLAKEFNVELVSTMDVHYPRPEDAEMQAVLHAVHRGKASVDDAMREWNYSVLLTLPESDESIYESLQRTGLSKKAAREAIENSSLIASQCNVTLPKAELLKYPISERDLKPWVHQ
jgi:DNA polymerase III subunit alpha